MARIVVAFDTSEGQTQKIAEFIAEQATKLGHEVSVLRVPELSNSSILEGYDGAIIGASIHVGRHSSGFVNFVENRRMWLDGLPVAFFSVSLSAAGSDEEQEEARGYVSSLLSETGWRPQSTATIGGGLRYRRYGFIKRFIMRRIARGSGHDTDTSRDHEYTDWQAVGRFAESFLEQFAHVDGPP